METKGLCPIFESGKISGKLFLVFASRIHDRFPYQQIKTFSSDDVHLPEMKRVLYRVVIINFQSSFLIFA